MGLTAHSTETFKKQCFESGMDQYSKQFILPVIPNIVPKPVDEKQLEDVLKKFNFI